MYKTNVKYLREAGYCKKNMQENIGNIIAKHNYFKISATLPRFE